MDENFPRNRVCDISDHFINICVRLAYYVACNGNNLPKFRDKISILFQRSRNLIIPLFFGYLEPLNGSDRLSRNFDNVIPQCAPKYQIVAHILIPSHLKPVIKHFSSFSIAISFIVRKFNC
jgi:hypothetical protein